MTDREKHQISPESKGPERPNLLEMQDQLNALPGYQTVALISMVRRIAYILQGNLAQYHALIASVQRPDVALKVLDTRDPSMHDDLLSEAERLLYNLVASMKARVDLLRAFMRRNFANDSEITNEYTNRVKHDFINPQSRFLEELRNQMTHHLLPVSRSQQTYSRGESAEFTLHFTFLLHTDSMLAWEWSSSVKEWLAERRPDLMILDVVDDYCTRAKHFDNWLAHRIELKHQEELAEYLDAVRVFNAEIDRVFGGG